ncbi:hypothetical protein KGF54_003706 [Candida jiufengensis]|uniref:uncharacterized protein n=1 Tax=Candida jiufengensis TaxID=497108 RepID=UPI0022248D1F|nr:uncharacterized protein KGF54_003706 [Candida jiufengensis]KAI5952839.1 hypothetical protein KGF54_003706 [Candida jiufengensis]
MVSISILSYLTIFITSTIANPVGKCTFPKDQGLVEVAKDGANKGWAMSPDESCVPGKYCPYACPPGQLMNQWDSSSKTYSFPGSLNGGLKCGNDGKLTKPFNDRGLCVDGKGTVSISNKMEKNVAFCQTVLPGNEAMLIPTNCNGKQQQTLAVPGVEYYADACVWGSSDKSKGNWAPYIAGMNMDKSGNTFIKIGVNPKYIDDFNNQKINFGVKIVCDDPSKCNGLGCEINPRNGFNKASGPSAGNSLGAAYCIVTATDHSKAKIEVFEA